MGKSGELLFVTGFFGAGKSTLVRAALSSIIDLEYLKTITTRPPRDEERKHGSVEYEFVDEEEYKARRAASKSWDHASVNRHSYGADVDGANQRLARGVNIIGCTVPDHDAIVQASGLYAVKPVLVWVNTPLRAANERLLGSDDEHRRERVNHPWQTDANAEDVKRLEPVIFEPKGSLESDTARFVDTIQGVIRGGYTTAC